MIALLLTAFLEALDNLIVTPALPRMVSSLHGFDQYTWVVTAYLLATTAVVPLAGKLSDQFGRKGFLLSGIAIFLLGSGLAGASQTMSQLILFRAMQGLGTGIGIGLVPAVIGDLFPPEQRASKQSLVGIVFGVSQLCGPTLGGWITDHGPLLSGFVTEATRWRWLFYLNLPAGLLALLVLATCLPVQAPAQITRRPALAHIDWIGALLLVAATGSLLLALSLRNGQAWTSWPRIVLLAAAALCYVLFLAIERMATEPVLPLGLFRQSTFTVNALQTLIQGMILIGIFIPLSLFLQDVLTLSPTGTGALLTALSLSLTLGAALAGISISLRKRYQLTAIVGATILTLGLLLLTLLAQQGNLLLLGLTLVLVGLGAGSFFTIQMVAAQNAIPQTQLGVGTGVVRYLAQLGMTLGAALMGVIVNGIVATARPALTSVLLHGFGAVLALSTLLLLSTCLLKDAPTAQTPTNPPA
jgi:MFS family permease